jgi:hypothetical protein
MKYYKHTETGEVFAYETETEREQWGAPELVEMTQGEVEAHLNPPPPLPVVPEQVSRVQGKSVLITEGLWSDVLDFVEAMTDPTDKALAEVALNDTTYWRRDSPTMQAIATALGITSEQLDDLFIRASKISL